MNRVQQLFSKNKIILVLLLVLFQGSFSSLYAQTNTFSGATGGNWGVSANWSLGLVPVLAHDVVIPDNKDVIINVATAVCKTLTINTGGNSNNISVGANTLTVSGLLTINVPTANSKNKIVSVTSGILNCGSVLMGNSGGGSRDCRITVASGVVNVFGDVTMNGATSENQIILDGVTTGGTLNMGRNFVGTGDLIPGTFSTVNFNGTVAQVIPMNGSFVYNDIVINNTAGVTFSANVTVTRVLGNITVQTGILNSGGFTIKGNAGKTFTVADGAKFNTTTASDTFPNALPTIFMGTTSTVEFSRGGAQNIFDVASPGYGHLIVSTSGVKTAGSALDIQGNVTVNSGATLAFVANVHNIAGNLSNSGTVTVTTGGINLMGSWSNSAIFTAGTGTVNFNSGATGKTISGTITGASGKFNNLTFNGVGGGWSIAGDLDVANTLVVTNGAVVVGGVLTVAGASALTVGSGGMLTLENGSSLIQSGYLGANSGNIIVKSNSTPIILDDYTYWSSPVIGTQTLLNFSPATQADKFFTYHNLWSPVVAATDTFVKGIGYAIRSPEAISYSVPIVVEHQFVGVPNNGNVDVPVALGPDPVSSRLIGNPYPSVIDADAFISANLIGTGSVNQTITGTLYFWTHNHSLTGNNYSASDYATYNLSGGTAVATGTGNTEAPTKYISSGQGFAVHAVANGNVSFRNTMRAGMSNRNFYRSPNVTTAVTALESHRIWLNLTNGTSSFSQALVGYVETATDGIDPGLDGLCFGLNQHVLYSLISDDFYTIQARVLPFVDADVVPLGFKTNIAGNTTISIDHVDGLFSDGQNIYLEDQLLNVSHDLKSAPYTFPSETGTFNSRFLLRYINGTLGVDNFNNLTNTVTVASKNQVIKIKSQSEVIDQVMVFDMLGRQIFENKKINNKEVVISDLTSHQALILKIILSNGQVVTKKIVY
jgi:hypothetical protein